jgi:phosphatidylethanolamine/phosphatidyl-N-methylethanolamine N-methyltransferase
MNGTLAFIKAALKNPLQISTVFQTSPWLAELLLSSAPLENARHVIELGPGAGAITAPLLKKISPSTLYTGIELNSDLVDHLRKTFPDRRFVRGSAEDLSAVTVESGPADVIISSLPWTVFTEDLQRRIIGGLVKGLTPGGVFATYVCLNAVLYPTARSLGRLLGENFSRVERSRTEWRNVPPAFVYVCTL